MFFMRFARGLMSCSKIDVTDSQNPLVPLSYPSVLRQQDLFPFPVPDPAPARVTAPELLLALLLVTVQDPITVLRLTPDNLKPEAQVLCLATIKGVVGSGH
jgi:hypothetical protein